MMVATALSYLSGLHWVAPDLDLATLVGTTAVVNTCNAIICRLIAHNNGYPKTPATVLGAVFGVWALAVVMIAPRRSTTPEREVPGENETSDATPPGSSLPDAD
jgi:hypothetical protein